MLTVQEAQAGGDIVAVHTGVFGRGDRRVAYEGCPSHPLTLAGTFVSFIDCVLVSALELPRSVCSRMNGYFSRGTPSGPVMLEN